MPEQKPLSGLHKMQDAERKQVLIDAWDLAPEAQTALFDSELNLESISENALTEFPFAFRVAPNVLVNDQLYHIPLVTEEQSVVGGLSAAAKLAYEAGGIKAHVAKNYALGQLLLYGIDSPEAACGTIHEDAPRLIGLANERQNHVRAYELRARPTVHIDGAVVVDVEFDPGESMGAAKASALTETIADELLKMSGARGYAGRVVSNAAGRQTEASVRLPVSILDTERKDPKTGQVMKWDGPTVAERVEYLSRWAAEDPMRAPTNNKGIMNGVTAVALATAQDTRAIEAANHWYAAHLGARREPPVPYTALSEWRVDDDHLVGKVDLLLPMGVKGGEFGRYPKAQVAAQNILRADTGNKLAEVTAAAGLLQNYAALRMLSTFGVSVGHGQHR